VEVTGQYYILFLNCAKNVVQMRSGFLKDVITFHPLKYVF